MIYVCIFNSDANDLNMAKINGSCCYKKMESAHLLLREEKQITQSVAPLLRQIRCSPTHALSIALPVSSSADERCGEKW